MVGQSVWELEDSSGSRCRPEASETPHKTTTEQAEWARRLWSLGPIPGEEMILSALSISALSGFLEKLSFLILSHSLPPTRHPQFSTRKGVNNFLLEMGGSNGNLEQRRECMRQGAQSLRGLRRTARVLPHTCAASSQLS